MHNIYRKIWIISACFLIGLMAATTLSFSSQLISDVCDLVELEECEAITPESVSRSRKALDRTQKFVGIAKSPRHFGFPSDVTRLNFYSDRPKINGSGSYLRI